MTEGTQNLPTQTLPINLKINLQSSHFKEEDLQAFGYHILNILQELSRGFDLSELDGVTISSDYDDALQKLDRGAPASEPLKASKGRVVGVAMAPSVLREGKVKSHLIFNADELYVRLNHDDKEVIKEGINIIAHECGHVCFNTAFNKNFPELVLHKRFPNITEMLRFTAGQGAWDEYFATFLSANIGKSDSESFVQVMLDNAATVPSEVASALSQYQLHGDVSQAIKNIGDIIRALMTLSGYFIGDALGKGLEPMESDRLKDESMSSWYRPHLESLVTALRALNDDYGSWSSFSPFESVLECYDGLLAHFGVVVDSTNELAPYVHFYKW